MYCVFSQCDLLSVLFRVSLKSGRPDSAMVPSVCGPNGDEAEIHVAHLPVHRVLWRAGSDKGGKTLGADWITKTYTTTYNNILSFLRSCITSSVTSWIILHQRATNVRFSLWQPVLPEPYKPFFPSCATLFYWMQTSGPPTRKFNLAHLPGEWGVSWCRVGEALLLQEYRGARDLLGPSSHLPPDGGAGSRAGGGLQEQESMCTLLLISLVPKCLLFTLTLIFRTIAHQSVSELSRNESNLHFLVHVEFQSLLL